eukprot:409431-Pyramimonas_sp.AAC.1
MYQGVLGGSLRGPKTTRNSIGDVLFVQSEYMSGPRRDSELSLTYYSLMYMRQPRSGKSARRSAKNLAERSG